MSYEFHAHTADLGIAGTGDSFGAAAAAVADGMAAAMCDAVPERGERFELTATGESREAALFEYLDEVILQRDVREVLPVDNTATVTTVDGAYHVTASARGVPLAAVTAREIKAVTYSEMAIENTADGWSVHVVVDV